MTRRHWLQKSAAFAGAASLLQADDALPNRSSEAKPITPAERTERIARAQQLMAENKLDAIVLTGGTSLVYFSGIRWWNSELCNLKKDFSRRFGRFYLGGLLLPSP